MGAEAPETKAREPAKRNPLILSSTSRKTKPSEVSTPEPGTPAGHPTEWPGGPVTLAMAGPALQI